MNEQEAKWYTAIDHCEASFGNEFEACHGGYTPKALDLLVQKGEVIDEVRKILDDMVTVTIECWGMERFEDIVEEKMTPAPPEE